MIAPRIASCRRTPGLGLGLAGALLALASARPAGAADDVPQYNRDVRPILAENCFLCHGPDKGTRKADLRLDKREDALAKEAFVPGDADASELVARVLSADAEEMMPPPASAKKLTAEQKDILRRWVAAGAEYQPHWAFLAPKRPEPPAVKDAAWARNPIDRFILAKLEKQGLHPRAEADRRTLARRVSLDLTGLPPAPAEVEAFVADPAADAYEQYVDRLMQSPRWGEHRGRYWLDAARYADTHGIHMDNHREMWSYRANVIAAFNRNQPFDQFTVEQLAGDLLPNRTLEQQVASGFNRCNITTSEGGAIDAEYLVLYARDRTETTSQVWLGLTTGCAVCHDHKYDPISQKEFYELSAFFNNTTQAAMDGNIATTPPTVFVPEASDRARWDALGPLVAAARQQLDARKAAARPEFDKWLAAATPESLAALSPSADLKFRARLDPVDSEVLHRDPASPIEDFTAGDFEKDQPFSVAAWVKVPAGANGAILARMAPGVGPAPFRGWDFLLQGGKLGSHIISAWPGDAMKVSADGGPTPGKWSHVMMTYDGSGKPGGVTFYVDGIRRSATVDVDALKGTTRATVPLKVGRRDADTILPDGAIHDARIYGRALPAPEVLTLVGGTRAARIVAQAAPKRDPAELNTTFDWYLGTFDKPAQDLGAAVAVLEQEQNALRARGTTTHVMQEKPTPAMANILARGDYDKPKDAVTPNTPAVLPSMTDLPRNRLGLARWLLRADQPLMARVTVNRFWQELFGSGLVKTTGDFGVTGDLPSHPELLDWLAVEFREGGWDVKKFYKMMVTSAAYRQSAASTREEAEKDPGNRLLAHGPRFRMDAEMVRDSALYAGGLLVEKLGGPSVYPYQPQGVWEAVAMPESNSKKYMQDTGEKLYRRSMYTIWKRSAPPASMDVFNAPSREVCTVRRERTNTPLQALVTLNDPQFVEAARHLAQLALHAEGVSADESVGLDLMARRLLARPFRPEELAIVRASLAGLLAHYRAHADEAPKLLAFGESKADPGLDPPTLAAWTMLANELMNLDENLNK